MPELPSASTTIDDAAGAFAGSTGFLVVLGCVATNADNTPRVYSSAKGLLSQHGYAPAVDYAAMHFEETKKPIIFVGMPVVTAGAVRRQDDTGVTGTSTLSVAAGGSGILEEVEGIVTVITDGTVGTAGIVLDVSIDNGRSSTRVRMGTATSYTIPYVGIVLTLGTGTLFVDDVFEFATSAPLWDSAGISAAKTALASQLKLSRSWLVAGDVANATQAGYVRDAINAYDTANDRFAYARISVKDREPFAQMSTVSKSMQGAPSLTFAEVGASGDTITRATGSWITDGFAVGDTIIVTGSALNNITAVIASLSATVITLGTEDLVAEVTAVASIVASTSITFAEVGASGDTITRSSGSWITEGFAVGDAITITGTASNNITSAVIASLSATVITLGADDLAAEVIASHLITVTKGQTVAAYVAAMDTAFASISDEKRVDISLGRGRKKSPITNALMRRPAAWAASLREYQHDLHIPTWRKADGPLKGWSLLDDEGNTVEFDERIDGGALTGGFTCLRSWSNGPVGAFVALSLTRALEGSLLSRTHNASVANLACTIAQAETENAIGQVLVLNDDGTATQASLSLIESRVNTQLENNLLTNKEGEGQRASKAVWAAAGDDILNIPAATLNGVLTLNLNGTIETIATRVLIQTGGA